MDKILGIDLGTTNSEVALVIDGQPRIIPARGEKMLPSVVGLSPTNELLVGTPAKNQYLLYPERTIRSIKRHMGSKEKIILGDREYSPSEISAIILRQLKAHAETSLGESFQKAVITVPAYFNDTQRRATRDAGEIAGLEVVRIINEPTAAALAYGLDREEDKIIAVYDLGGGTFDLSLIELNSGVIEVRATHGNTHLGGDDFDAKLVSYIVDRVKIEHGIDLRQDRKALARITSAAEKAKIELSDRPFSKIAEEFIALKDGKPLHLEIEISRREFERMIEELLLSTIESIEIALKDAELQWQDIDKIILVGGSTRIPLISSLIEDKFALKPHLAIDPEMCVALGAAVQGAIIAGEPIDAILVDVAPFSLGIQSLGFRYGVPDPDIYSILIPRGMAIPTSKTEVFNTLWENQQEAEIKVFQGESPKASENELLGEFIFSGIRPGPPGKEILVQFDYDINGIVHIKVKEKDTGKEESITISATRPSLLKPEEKTAAKETLANLRDKTMPWLNVIEYKKVEITLNKAKEKLDKLSDKEKQKIETIIAQLEESLNNGKDRNIVLRLNDELTGYLFALES
jgi:molecular chaperone DnaK